MRGIDRNFEILNYIKWTPQNRPSNESKGYLNTQNSFKQYKNRFKSLMDIQEDH